jgi:hypothetical protein
MTKKELAKRTEESAVENMVACVKEAERAFNENAFGECLYCLGKATGFSNGGQYQFSSREILGTAQTLFRDSMRNLRGK